MASYTPNLNLYKPDDSDNYEDFREGFNENMDKLDQGGGNQNIAENYDETATYVVGDYVIYDGLLYKCVTAVTTAETFDPTKWTHVVVTDEMGSGGGGSGDTVAWTQIQQTGTKIAEININGTSQDVYAPQGGGSGGHTIYDENGTALTQENGLQFTGAVSVSDDSVNGRTVVDVEGGVIYLPTIYSEEERQVGVWRDGKPLYQKTLVMNNLNLNTSGTAVDITSLGVDMCCPVYEGSYYIVSGVKRGFARLEYQQPNEVYLYPAVNRTGTTSFITLQYTKTTDTAGSGDWTPSGARAVHYSTNEQVIGTWIDGKPVYECTFYLATASLSSKEFPISTGLSNIKKILTCTGVLTNGSETYMLPFERLTERESIRTFARVNSDGTVTLNVITGVGGSSVYSTVTDVYVTITYTKTTD